MFIDEKVRIVILKEIKGLHQNIRDDTHATKEEKSNAELFLLHINKRLDSIYDKINARKF